MFDPSARSGSKVEYFIVYEHTIELSSENPKMKYFVERIYVELEESQYYNKIGRLYVDL
jgi:hypothetical protein